MGAPTGLSSWDISFTHPGSGGPNYGPIPNVGTIWVRVRQTGGARTCATYTLNLGN